jgi:hypothetical protein
MKKCRLITDLCWKLKQSILIQNVNEMVKQFLCGVSFVLPKDKILINGEHIKKLKCTQITCHDQTVLMFKV